MITRRNVSDSQLLRKARDLDAAYARADSAQLSVPTRPVFRIYWDNGAGACGVFPDEYPIEGDAQRAADDWAAESNARDDIDPESDNAYTAEVMPAEIAIDPEAETQDEMGELRKAALSQGQP